MSGFVFPLITPSEVSTSLNDPVDPVALSQSKAIVDSLKDAKPSERTNVLMSIGKKFGDITADKDTYIVSKEEMKNAYDTLTKVEKEALDSIQSRVATFASAQRSSITDMKIPIPGGHAGHTVTACRTAGCYAPGGRYPLPSSVIMTVATARAAGCSQVVLSSPRPQQITMAAGYVAGADVFVGVGGAQAIAAMAYGVPGSTSTPPIPPCDIICGPGNKWVTAAKSLVHGHCGIDMLAGPSEVLVICDGGANAKVVASDLIAQAEHDVVARPIVVGTDQDKINEIVKECKLQLDALPEPNKGTAMAAFATGFGVVVPTIDEAIAISDTIAPEHLEIQTKDPVEVANRCKCYGGLFIGENAAEVIGDYGAGPNHTLPTGGTGRYTGGLSVFSFLGIRTYMNIEDKAKARKMVEETVVMARCEGLEGHARAAEQRL